jgi:hypothetical protein
MPGLISGVPVGVGTTGRVAVAVGGNQTIVGVGVAVSVAGGVSVGDARSTGRQATKAPVIARRSQATTKQSLINSRLLRRAAEQDTALPDPPRNDRLCLGFIRE